MESDNGRVMTVRDLAGYLRIHPSTIYHQLKLGQLPAFKVGSDWRFNRESIDRWRFDQVSWLGLSEQEFRVDKWNICLVHAAAICGSQLK